MDFKKWLFQEGLIPVPQKMMDEIMQGVVHVLISYVESKLLKGRKRKYPEHNKKSKEIQKKYGVKPSTWRRGLELFEVDYDISDLPQNIQNAFTHERPQLTVWLDFENKIPKDGWSAKYVDSKNKKPMEAVLVDPEFIKKYIWNDPSDLDYFIAHIKKSVMHEMSHMVQFRALYKLDSAYKNRVAPDGDSDYYLDPYEFDPQIKTALFDFQNTMRVQNWINKSGGSLNRRSTDEREAIDIYTGVKKPGNSHFGVNRFFLNLKQHNQKAWQLAVKKFVAALHDQKYQFYDNEI
jgi:hypothetical protein